MALSLCAYSPAAPAPKPPGPASVEKLHKAVGEENHAEAKRLADLLLQSPNQADRIAASLVYGRILLSLGQKDLARQYLAGMKRLNLDPDAAQLVQVYEAWLAFLDGREDEGLKALEQVLVDKKPLASTAEAADVLAILYLARGRGEMGTGSEPKAAPRAKPREGEVPVPISPRPGGDRTAAKRAVDFGLAFIKYDKSAGGKFPGYVETLLKNRLKTDLGDAFPEAKKLYDQAEKLRQEGKFAEAGKLFFEVQAKWPRSLWSHASGFRIGQCLAGLNRKLEAQAHWQAFLVGQASSLPSSSAPRQVGNLPHVAPLPWRGQAAVGLIDLVLETTVDVKTARELAQAAGAVLDKGPDEEAGSGSKPSWDAAAFDIRLRQGTLDLVSKHPDQAAAAFEQAANLAGGLARRAPADAPEKPAGGEGAKLPSPSGRGVGGEGTLAGLEKLIDSAKTGWPLIPADLLLGDQRLTQAVTIATAYNLTARHEPAAGLFDAVLSSSQRKSLAPYRSYAAQGKARAIVGLAGEKAGSGQGTGGRSPTESPPTNLPSPAGGRGAGGEGDARRDTGLLLQAKFAYLRALDEAPTAAWHEDTLRELALLLEELAENSTSLAGGLARRVPAAAPERPSAPGAARNFILHPSYFILRQEALPYWAALIEKFPQTRHLPEALYHAGVLYSEGPKANPDQSIAHFERLTKEFPQSPWTGGAYFRLIDVALERTFDVKRARAFATQAADWAKAAPNAPAPELSPEPPWVLDGAYAQETQVKRAAYECLLRAGMVAYLAGDFDTAVEWVNLAGPKAPPQGFTANPDYESYGLYYLVKAIRSKKALTNPRAVEAAKTDEQRMLLQLGDLYLETIRPDKAEEVFLRIMGHDPQLGKVPLALEGYSLLQLAVALDRQPGRRHESLRSLDLLAGERFAGTYWGGYGLFRKALYTYNLEQNPAASLPLYQRFLRQYPDHPMRELAHYYAIADACELKNEAIAVQVGAEFRKKYPNSQWLDSIATRLRKLQAQKEGDRR